MENLTFVVPEILIPYECLGLLIKNVKEGTWATLFQEIRSSQNEIQCFVMHDFLHPNFQVFK